MHASAPTQRSKRDWLDWPFFGDAHRALVERLDRFIASDAVAAIDHADVDRACRKLARALGEAGLLEAAVATPQGDASSIDSRSACLARETLAWRDGLADFAFAMQGLAAGDGVAEGASRGAARRLRSFGEGSRLGCRRNDLRRARRGRRVRSRWREDMGFQRRHR
jgi:hypothetical protein